MCFFYGGYYQILSYLYIYTKMTKMVPEYDQSTVTYKIVLKSVVNRQEKSNRETETYD